MKNKFNRTLNAGLLLIALMGASQPASFAGLLNLLDDENESISPGAQKQNVDPYGSTSAVKDNTKLDVNGMRSTFSELLHDEFPRDNFYRRLANARKNIDKGEKMMQSCNDNHAKAEYKKGKVMKEIGEKEIAALKTDSRFPSDSSVSKSAPEHEIKTEDIPDSL